MIPDLGKYATTVLGAYGATLALIGALTLVSVLAARRARARLARLEGKRPDHAGRDGTL